MNSTRCLHPAESCAPRSADRRAWLRGAAALAATALPAGRAAFAQINAGPYVPTPTGVVDAMLAMAELRAGDVLYDLGSGDGRIVIEACRFAGVRAVGVEIDPELVERARRNAREAGVSDRAAFRTADLFRTDLSEATVVTLYLLPDIVRSLVPKLARELRPGARVISHDYALDPLVPDLVRELVVPEKKNINNTERAILMRYRMGATG